MQKAMDRLVALLLPMPPAPPLSGLPATSPPCRALMVSLEIPMLPRRSARSTPCLDWMVSEDELE